MATGFGRHKDGTWWLIAGTFRQRLPEGIEIREKLPEPILIGKPRTPVCKAAKREKVPTTGDTEDA